CDHGIGWRSSVSQQCFDRPPKLVFLRDSSIVRKGIDFGHLSGEPDLQELPQERDKGLFSSPLDQNRDLHARAPRRPLRQSSSRVYSFSHSSKSSSSALVRLVMPSSVESRITTSEGSRNRMRVSECVATMICVRCEASLNWSASKLSSSGCRLTSGSSRRVRDVSPGLWSSVVNHKNRRVPSDN